MTRSRLWLALVLVGFCLPLFIGLGDRDLDNDEAIYSFAVDRILEAGDWLVPKASPEDNLPFLEKPPLKFWIVAAPIKIGLLPHSEFGLRFWDAVSGSIAFVYVFLLGRRLFSPLTGAIAVMALFAHQPLLFEHGLRDNVMEAPLLLSYCGAVFHFLSWSAAADPGPSRRAPRGRGHALATGLYFVLGFMVKYVAALFLPMVLVAAALLVKPEREKLLRHWALWTSIAGLAVVLIVPWFAYAYELHGQRFWDGMFKEHVVQRFTASLDPGHLHPWYYYAERLWSTTLSTGAGLALVGLPFLVWQAVKRRSFEATLLIVWLLLPVLVISAGSSKLYHYAYPFLPPVALAAGYGAAMLFALAPAPFERALSAYYRRRAGGTAGRGDLRQPILRALLAAVAALAIVLVVASLAFGTVRVPLPGGQVFRSGGTVRAAIVAFVCVVPLGLYGRTRRIALLLMVTALLPLAGYRTSLSQLHSDRHPFRTLSQCVLRVQASGAGTPGMYTAWPNPWVWHPVNYYFRRVRPWERAAAHPDAGRIERHAMAVDAPDPRPVLISRPEFLTLPADVQAAVSAPIDLERDVLLLLPGPYEACRAEGKPLLARR